MTVLLETHVFIAGLMDPLSPASRIVRMAIEGTVTICVTDAILTDYRSALSHDAFGIDPRHARTVLSFFSNAGRCRTTAPIPAGDMFMAAALGGDVAWWVVPDDAQRRCPLPESVRIVTAEDFLSRRPPPDDAAQSNDTDSHDAGRRPPTGP